MVVNFISSKDSDEICVMRANSINTEILMGNETDENNRILNINI